MVRLGPAAAQVVTSSGRAEAPGASIEDRPSAQLANRPNGIASLQGPNAPSNMSGNSVNQLTGVGFGAT